PQSLSLSLRRQPHERRQVTVGRQLGNRTGRDQDRVPAQIREGHYVPCSTREMFPERVWLRTTDQRRAIEQNALKRLCNRGHADGWCFPTECSERSVGKRRIEE